MGKLGGGELNYHSDLDIVFLYDGGDETWWAEHARGIAPHELFSDPSPYLFAVFAPTAHERCTLTSPAKARHVLRVHRARRGTTELIFEDRTLAPTGSTVRPCSSNSAATARIWGGPSRCW
jgi:hypothetical protein